MELTQMIEYIRWGYESVDLTGIPVEMVSIGRPGIKEFAFQFPYYLNDKDLAVIGKSMAELKICAASGQDTSLLEFKGRTLSVNLLLKSISQVMPRIEYAREKCEKILQRIPLEVMLDKEIEKAIVYERYGIELKKEEEK